MAHPWLRAFGWVLLASIFLGHFFISLGRFESIWTLLTESWYYWDLAYTSAINLIIVGYLTLLNYRLNSRYPLTQLAKRLLYQGIFGVVIPGLLAYLLTLAYMTFILHQNILETTFLIYEFPIAMVVIVAINMFLILLSSLRAQAAPALVTENLASTNVFLLSQGERTVPVSTGEIACFTKQGDYCLVYTLDGKQFVSSEVLDDVEAKLNQAVFFRANRQFIVNRKICEYFSADRSGKINLTLKAPLNQTISVSQKRAMDFRNWITKD